MKFDPFNHHRRSTRLRGYDYSQAGAYFVTICVQQHQCLFGKVVNAEMDLNDWGTIANECWLAIPEHFPYVELDEYGVMPNHVHGIVVITDDQRGVSSGVQLNAATGDVPRDTSNPFSMMSPKRKTLSVIIRTYKAAVTTRCRELNRHDFVWQGSYHDHIIRNEREWNAIAKYICENPANWNADRDNPANFRKQPPPKTVDDYWRDAGL
jgi:REP element-mobilizing transposase RayT